MDSGRVEPVALEPTPAGPLFNVAFGSGVDSNRMLVGANQLDPAAPTGRAGTVSICAAGQCTETLRVPGEAAPANIQVSRNHVLAWTGSVAYASADGGLTWLQIDLPSGGQPVAAAHDDNGRLLLLVTSPERTVILASADGGARWPSLALPTSPSATTISTTSDGRIIVGRGPVDGGFLCSVDGGSSWGHRCPS
jgi:hypothetical protein